RRPRAADRHEFRLGRAGGVARRLRSGRDGARGRMGERLAGGLRSPDHAPARRPDSAWDHARARGRARQLALAQAGAGRPMLTSSLQLAAPAAFEDGPEPGPDAVATIDRIRRAL